MYTIPQLLNVPDKFNNKKKTVFEGWLWVGLDLGLNIIIIYSSYV